jgi:AraC-like DNA-binding protein
MLQILVYNILSLRLLYIYRKKLKENFSSISKINFSWLSFVIIGYTTAHIISTTIQLISFADGYNSFLKIILFTVFLIFFNIIFFKAWQQPEIFSVLEENIRYKSSKLKKQEAESWIQKLNDIIKLKKPFLNPGLTINQLAEDISISPRVLSQIINEYYNQNFYDYINRLRIEESKAMLADSSSKKTVLEILYDVGFNSKTAFNIAFKKTTGLTPTEFRKKTRKESESIEL